MAGASKMAGGGGGGSRRSGGGGRGGGGGGGRTAARRNAKKKGPPGHRANTVRDIPRADSSRDDDFEDPPSAAVPRVHLNPDWTMPKSYSLTPQEEVNYPKLKIRGTLLDLLKAFQDFNDAQRDVVRAMRFGHLLQLNINETPARLGYWLVEHFDATDGTLELQKGRKIYITSEDVAASLGFLNGGVDIKRKCKSEVGDLVREFRDRFGRPDGNITPSAVCTAMLEIKDAGRWFKIYFAVFVISIFVESLQHGMSNQNYIPSFDDVDRIGQLSWCDLFIESLLSSKLAWEKTGVGDSLVLFCSSR